MNPQRRMSQKYQSLNDTNQKITKKNEYAHSQQLYENDKKNTNNSPHQQTSDSNTKFNFKICSDLQSKFGNYSDDTSSDDEQQSTQNNAQQTMEKNKLKPIMNNYNELLLQQNRKTSNNVRNKRGTPPPPPPNLTIPENVAPTPNDTQNEIDLTGSSQDEEPTTTTSSSVANNEVKTMDNDDNEVQIVPGPCKEVITTITHFNEQRKELPFWNGGEFTIAVCAKTMLDLINSALITDDTTMNWVRSQTKTIQNLTVNVMAKMKMGDVINQIAATVNNDMQTVNTIVVHIHDAFALIVTQMKQMKDMNKNKKKKKKKKPRTLRSGSKNKNKSARKRKFNEVQDGEDSPNIYEETKEIETEIGVTPTDAKRRKIATEKPKSDKEEMDADVSNEEDGNENENENESENENNLPSTHTNEQAKINEAEEHAQDEDENEDIDMEEVEQLTESPIEQKEVSHPNAQSEKVADPSMNDQNDENLNDDQAKQQMNEQQNAENQPNKQQIGEQKMNEQVSNEQPPNDQPTNEQSPNEQPNEEQLNATQEDKNKQVNNNQSTASQVAESYYNDYPMVTVQEAKEMEAMALSQFELTKSGMEFSRKLTVALISTTYNNEPFNVNITDFLATDGVVNCDDLQECMTAFAASCTMYRFALQKIIQTNNRLFTDKSITLTSLIAQNENIRLQAIQIDDLMTELVEFLKNFNYADSNEISPPFPQQTGQWVQDKIGQINYMMQTMKLIAGIATNKNEQVITLQKAMNGNDYNSKDLVMRLTKQQGDVAKKKLHSHLMRINKFFNMEDTQPNECEQLWQAFDDNDFVKTLSIHQRMWNSTMTKIQTMIHSVGGVSPAQEMVAVGQLTAAYKHLHQNQSESLIAAKAAHKKEIEHNAAVYEKSLESWKKSNSNLQKSLTAEGNKSTRFKKQYESLLHTHNKQKDEWENKYNSLKATSNKLEAKLQENYDAVKTNYNAEKNKLTKNEKELSKIKEELNRVRKARGKLDETRKTLEALVQRQSNKITQQTTAINQQNETLKDQKNELDNNTKMQSNLNDTKNKLKDAKTQIDGLNDKMQALEDNEEELKNRIKKMTLNKDECEKKMREALMRVVRFANYQQKRLTLANAGMDILNNDVRSLKNAVVDKHMVMSKVINKHKDGRIDAISDANYYGLTTPPRANESEVEVQAKLDQQYKGMCVESKVRMSQNESHLNKINEIIADEERIDLFMDKVINEAKKFKMEQEERANAQSESPVKSIRPRPFGAHPPMNEGNDIFGNNDNNNDNNNNNANKNKNKEDDNDVEMEVNLNLNDDMMEILFPKVCPQQVSKGMNATNNELAAKFGGSMMNDGDGQSNPNPNASQPKMQRIHLNEWHNLTAAAELRKEAKVVLGKVLAECAVESHKMIGHMVSGTKGFPEISDTDYRSWMNVIIGVTTTHKGSWNEKAYSNLNKKISDFMDYNYYHSEPTDKYNSTAISWPPSDKDRNGNALPPDNNNLRPKDFKLMNFSCTGKRKQMKEMTVLTTSPAKGGKSFYEAQVYHSTGVQHHDITVEDKDGNPKQITVTKKLTYSKDRVSKEMAKASAAVTGIPADYTLASKVRAPGDSHQEQMAMKNKYYSPPIRLGLYDSLNDPRRAFMEMYSPVWIGINNMTITVGISEQFGLDVLKYFPSMTDRHYSNLIFEAKDETKLIMLSKKGDGILRVIELHGYGPVNAYRPDVNYKHGFYQIYNFGLENAPVAKQWFAHSTKYNNPTGFKECFDKMQSRLQNYDAKKQTVEDNPTAPYNPGWGGVRLFSRNNQQSKRRKKRGNNYGPRPYSAPLNNNNAFRYQSNNLKQINPNNKLTNKYTACKCPVIIRSNIINNNGSCNGNNNHHNCSNSKIGIKIDIQTTNEGLIENDTKYNDKFVFVSVFMSIINFLSMINLDNKVKTSHNKKDNKTYGINNYFNHFQHVIISNRKHNYRKKRKIKNKRTDIYKPFSHKWIKHNKIKNERECDCEKRPGMNFAISFKINESDGLNKKNACTNKKRIIFALNAIMRTYINELYNIKKREFNDEFGEFETITAKLKHEHQTKRDIEEEFHANITIAQKHNYKGLTFHINSRASNQLKFPFYRALGKCRAIRSSESIKWSVDTFQAGAYACSMDEIILDKAENNQTPMNMIPPGADNQIDEEKQQHEIQNEPQNESNECSNNECPNKEHEHCMCTYNNRHAGNKKRVKYRRKRKQNRKRKKQRQNGNHKHKNKNKNQNQNEQANYYHRIDGIPAEDWETKIAPKIHAKKNYFQIKSYDLLLPKDINKQEMGIGLITTKSLKIHNLMNMLKIENVIPNTIIYNRITKEERQKLLHLNTKIDEIDDCKASILGCGSTKDFTEAEEFIKLIENKNSQPQIYKTRHRGVWIIMLTFQSSTARNKFIMRFIAKKKNRLHMALHPEYQKFKIYHKTNIYNRIKMQQDSDQAQLSVYKQISQNFRRDTQIENTIKDEMKKIIRNCFDEQIKSEAEEMCEEDEQQHHIDPNLLRFLQFYTIYEQNGSINLVKQNKDEYNESEELSLVSFNSNGKPWIRLQKNGSLHSEIKLKQPTIVLMQEHLQMLLRRGEFNQLCNIEGYTLIAHVKAERIHTNKRVGRPSSGLAIWMRNDIMKNYILETEQADTQLIVVKATPKPNVENRTVYRIINAYVRPFSANNNNEHKTPFSLNEAKKAKLRIAKVIADSHEKGIIAVGGGDINGDPFREIPKNKISNVDKRSIMLNEILEQNNITTVNEKLAFGVPTNRGGRSDIIQRTYHTNDLLFSHKDHINKWKIMDVTNPNEYDIFDKTDDNENKPSKKTNDLDRLKEELQDHAIIYAKSTFQMEKTVNDNPFYYRINYNDSDNECVEHMARHQIMKQCFKLRDLVNDAAENENDEIKKHEIIDLGHMALQGIFHISALRIYGLKKVVLGSNNPTAATEEIQQLQNKYHELAVTRQAILRNPTPCPNVNPDEDEIENETEDDSENKLSKQDKIMKQLITKRKLNDESYKQLTPIQAVDTKLTIIKKQMKQYSVSKQRAEDNKRERYMTGDIQNSIFKKYSGKKRAERNPFPAQLKNTDGTLRDIEDAYLRFLKKLYEAHNDAEQISEENKTKYFDSEMNYTPTPIDLFSEENIKNVIKKANKNAAPGITATPNSFWKAGAIPMQKILSKWFELFNKFKYVPKRMKIDLKSILQKYEAGANKITRMDPSNYRPIALQDTLYKLFDACVLNAINAHLKQNNIIIENQAGFKSEEGTMDHILTIETIIQYNPNGKFGFLDFRKAFDSIPREQMIKILLEMYKFDPELCDIIKTMYTDTASAVIINNKLSKLAQTQRGVQQGAISSPTLFNLFINNLLMKLNKHEAGCTIGYRNKLKINHLAYADDLVIMANSRQDLQELITICDEWANDWGLSFNLRKSNTLTMRGKKMQPIDLDNGKMKNVESYKYLGIPICEAGIDVIEYFKRITKNFRVSGHVTNNFCNEIHCNQKQRITMYTSTVRSHLQYGMEVLMYNKQEIKQMEEIQLNTIKRLLKLPYHTRKETILTILNLPPIEERILEAKIKYLYKLINNRTKSLASKCAMHILKYKPQRREWCDRIPPLFGMEDALKAIGQKCVFNINCTDQMPKKLIDKYAKAHLQRKRMNDFQNALKIQTSKTRKGFGWVFAPGDKEENPFGAHIEKYKGYQLKPDYAYIPGTEYSHDMNITQSMVQLDNNPNWSHPLKCACCKRSGIKYVERHKIFECPNYRTNRKNIMDSILTELDFINDHQPVPDMSKIIDLEMRGKILDARDDNDGIINGYNPRTDDNDWDPWLNIMFGIGINANCNKNVKKRIIKMLTAHLHLLIMMRKNQNDPNMIEWITLEHEDIKIKVSKEDIENGKIVARKLNEEGKVEYINMRKFIEQMPLHKLQSYNLGFGSASTRTDKQKKLANEYAKVIIELINEPFFSTDGSIKKIIENEIDNSIGGYGAVLVNHETNQEICTIEGSLYTNDSQKAELHGVNACLSKIIYMKEHQTNEYINNSKNITILCDCLSAINYIKKRFNPPYKYVKIVQQIHEKLATLRHHGVNITIIWIPGHVDNEWNDRADELAKKATEIQPSMNPTHSLKSWNTLLMIPELFLPSSEGANSSKVGPIDRCVCASSLACQRGHLFKLQFIYLFI